MSNLDIPRLNIQIIISPNGQPETPFAYLFSTLCEASNREAEGLKEIGPPLVNKMKDRRTSRETETKQEHSR